MPEERNWMYRLNAEQNQVIEQAIALADECVAPHAPRIDAEGTFCREPIAGLAGAGFLALTVPRELGGMGQDVRTACAVLDEIAQRCPSTAMVFKMHLCGVACYLAMPDNAADAIGAVVAGEHLTTLAWSERGSRSHFWAPVSKAREDNGGVRITAEKSWVTSANEAQGYVVSTGWARAEEPTDSMLYLLLDNDAGFSTAGPWDGMGMRGNASAPMRLEDCRVDNSRALCPEGRGFETMLGVVLPWFMLGNAAISVGIAEAAVRATRKHLMTQKMEHLGSRLADIPALRSKLAEMRTETDKARAHLVSVIDAVENPGPATQLLVLEIKSSAAESAIRVTDVGMQACGGAAFSKHLGLERFFRDARAAAVMAPTIDVGREFIGRALCDMEIF
jgi:alkylation response protein AidB-like acyl-CoA dehydrogenase